MNPLFNFTIALIIIGAYCVINWDGMLLYPIRKAYDWIESKLTKPITLKNLHTHGYIKVLKSSKAHDMGKREDTKQSKAFPYICKPLFTCPYCMSSVWTLAAYWATGKPLTLMIFPSTLCTMGIVVVLFSAIQYFRNEQ